MNRLSLNVKNTKRVTLILSIGLLLVSFTQKCYCTSEGCGDSFAVFISGLFGFYFSWAGLVWLANPLLLISWLKLNKDQNISLAASLLAATLGISFLLFTNIMDNEGGYYNEIISYKPGYWLWVLSSFTMLLGNLAVKYFNSGKQNT